MLPGPGISGGAGQGMTPTLNLRRSELQQLADRLARNLRSSEQFETLQDHVMLELTEEGLRIQMIEDSIAVFFGAGATSPMTLATTWLEGLGRQLAQLPNMVVIEGHTDAAPFNARPGASYTNWELSTDRANSSRRILLAGGLRPTQISSVRGFASQRLLVSNPLSPANRRVSITVLYWESDIFDDYGRPDEAEFEPFCPGYMGGECPDPEELGRAPSSTGIAGDFQ